jgi:tetratricopeptide (TPR) repeat protein
MMDYKRALYDFSAAIRFESRNPRSTDTRKLSDYYMFAGQANQLLGQYEEALAHYDVAIKKCDANSQLFYNRGLTNAWLERFEEGKKDFLLAVEKSSGQPMEMYKIRFNLGITLRRLGRIDDSIEELRKASDLQPNKAAVFNNLGLSQFER